jgi:hypothetical protein
MNSVSAEETQMRSMVHGRQVKTAYTLDGTHVGGWLNAVGWDGSKVHDLPSDRMQSNEIVHHEV